MPKNFLFGSSLKFATAESKSVDPFQKANELHHEFIGGLHLDTMLKLCDREKELPFVFEAIFTHLETKVFPTLSSHFDALFANQAFANAWNKSLSTKLDVAFTYFHNICGKVATYPKLQREVFQCFKEFGNVIALLHHLDGHLNKFDFKTFVQTSSFVGLDSVDSVRNSDHTLFFF